MAFDLLPYEIKRYFIFEQLDSISKICLRHAHMSCFEKLPSEFSKETQKDICKYTYSFFYYFRSYIQYYKATKYCAINGNCELLKTLHRAGYPADINICWAGAKNNHIKILDYAINNGLYWTGDNDTCAFAAEYGHFETLKWLRNNKISWDNQTTRCAAKSGYLEILKWVYQNKCPFHPDTLLNAAENGHLHIIEWLVNTNNFDNTDIYIGAAKGGHLHIIKWARKRGYRWDTSVCNWAAKKGHLEILKWVRSSDRYSDANNSEPAPWDEYVSRYAAKEGHFEVLKWLKIVNAPWNREVTATAASYGQIEILNWLITNNCPYTLQLMYAEALNNNNTKILQWFYIIAYYCLRLKISTKL